MDQSLWILYETAEKKKVLAIPGTRVFDHFTDKRTEFFLPGSLNPQVTNHFEMVIRNRNNQLFHELQRGIKNISPLICLMINIVPPDKIQVRIVIFNLTLSHDGTGLSDIL